MRRTLTSSNYSRLPRALAAAAACVLLVACERGVGPPFDTVPPIYRITGVTVHPLERIHEDGVIRYEITDTLRNRIAFTVSTHAERVGASDAENEGAHAHADQNPGFLVNPTIPGESWLSLDRPIRCGVEIPAGTNLLMIDAARNTLPGTPPVVLFGQLSPFAVGEVHLSTQACDLTPGPYVFTFRWQTAQGDVFEDVVAVYVDLSSD